jgi:hypothetical protein
VKFMDNETQFEEAMTKEQETKIEEVVHPQQLDVGTQTKEEIPPKNINHETSHKSLQRKFKYKHVLNVISS